MKTKEEIARAVEIMELATSKDKDGEQLGYILEPTIDFAKWVLNQPSTFEEVYKKIEVVYSLYEMLSGRVKADVN
jgi:hypothetical protein